MTDWHRRTRRLALSYLSIIMVMSLAFSAIMYGVASHQLNRPLTPSRVNEAPSQRRVLYEQDVRSRLVERDRITRRSMIVSLLVLNCFMLGGGAWLSLFLAKRTLTPIEAAMDAQNQFISDASHELKTPLTALLATNEVALRKKQLDDEKAREVLNRNITEVHKLQALTETLFTMNEADTEALMKESLWLDEAVSETIATLQEIATKKSMTIAATVPHIQVQANAIALSEMLTILLDNAIKYSPEHETVTVTGKQQKQSMLLQVSDAGMGIPEKDWPHIFDRFYRVDKARTRTDISGHGLGLSIAQSLARRQGFTLRLKESVEGKGSTFEMVIPEK